MANGPPTPPPTTDVEIQDEARMNDTLPPAVDGTSDPAPDTTSAQPPPQQPIQLQDPYGLIFPKIAELATQKRWIELIDIAEITEINARLAHSRQALSVLTDLSSTGQ